ncbi:MAG TPA: hypothetical protein VNZ52_16605 [Candidatus Thermoplasmatota archaeon]|nr:hypothetical protein [Candidatus Thermoplasmatota archaeon]
MEFRDAIEKGVREFRDALTDVLGEAEALSRMGVLKMEALNLELELDRVLRDVGREALDQARAGGTGAAIPLSPRLEERLRQAERLTAEKEAKERELQDLREARPWERREGDGGGSPSPGTPGP